MFQLQDSERFCGTELLSHQANQWRKVASFAANTVSFYQSYLSSETAAKLCLASDDWLQLPILTRRKLQECNLLLASTNYPTSHGKIIEHLTTGSTGTPVLALGNELTKHVWQTLTLREHFWHKRDFSKKLAIIRYVELGVADAPHGTQFPNWGSPVADIAHTGPCVLLNINSTTSQQIDWLLKHEPGYLLAYPSVLRAIALAMTERAIKFKGLIQLRSFGEILEPETRALLEEAFGVSIADIYSSQVVGNIAFQCPESGLYPFHP